MKPIIGISAYPRIADTSFGTTLLHTASRFYVQAVERAGGVGVILPVMDPETVSHVISAVHGVLLTGGGDIQPSLYGATPIPETRGVNPERDAFEIQLFQSAIEADLPILAVCRGMQLVNVALGGSLIQNVCSVTGQFHDDNTQWHKGVHRVRIEPDSYLAEALGATELTVNSVHHQALDRTAPDVRPVAWADDDTVEAIELSRTPVVLGVQWHPEVLEDWPEQQGLFRQLVEQAHYYANGASAVTTR